jgi:Ras-related protein Rab-5C
MRGTAHKVMLLGEIGVGKSSLAQRLLFDRFTGDYRPTIGVEIYKYDVPPAEVGDPMSLILWDTDGNFGDAIFSHVYIKQAAAALIVGDSTRPDTLDTMVKLARGFTEVFPGRAIHFILNKCDLITELTQISLPSGLNNYPLLRTSALSGQHVATAFAETAKAIRRRGH